MHRIDVRSSAALPVKMGIIGAERFYAEGDFRHPGSSNVFDPRFTDPWTVIDQCRRGENNESNCLPTSETADQ